ncbi:hypothetical protein PF010_g28990, partial [Phytophthora fragariae]
KCVEIASAESGGGINNTVLHTTKIPEAKLSALLRTRLDRMLRWVTETDTERQMLRVFHAASTGDDSRFRTE